jgi:hypothetical protein
VQTPSGYAWKPWLAVTAVLTPRRDANDIRPSMDVLQLEINGVFRRASKSAEPPEITNGFAEKVIELGFVDAHVEPCRSQ